MERDRNRRRLSLLWLMLAAGIVGAVIIGLFSSSSNVLVQLERRGAEVTRDRTYPSVAAAAAGSDGVILGRVVGVAAGVGMNWDIDDMGEERRILFHYGSPNALVHTLHLRLSVEEVVSATSAHLNGDVGELSIGLVVDDPVDPDAAAREFAALGDVIVLVVENAGLFDYEPDVWAVLEDGGFLGVVDGDGSIKFPALADAEPMLGTDLEANIDELRLPTPG